jgi:hypothetical protein
MFYLLQLYRLFKDKKDREYFIKIFSDLEFELDELGYRECPEDLIQDLLINHFGIEVESDRQLKKLTETILKKKDLSFLRFIDE